ncbi:Wadjet anti-phage system protein JetD domain-containing protein [Chitinophaga sp. NPDC101104]|uniref:Wadjet anti-phage system protein JetD domain-containing protein n=1 Tax=Chitinophaga sp. NPDC101104 TaxID=3390561 RepID=UPI003D00C0D8
MQDKIYLSQLEKHYNNYLQQLIEEREFTPIFLRSGLKKPETWEALEKSINCFQRFEKKDGVYGWTIQWEDWSSKKLGKQRWPSSIFVESSKDYLALLKKEKEVSRFMEQLRLLTEWNPAIRSWLSGRPMKVMELEGNWTGICGVVDYLRQNDLHAHFLRSLPVPVHTKFIKQFESTVLSLVNHLHPSIRKLESNSLEEALGLRQKPFLYPVRWLDTSLQQRHLPHMEVIGLSRESLQRMDWPIQEIWVVENETTLFMLPPRPNAIAICSEGYAIRGLSEIPMLHYTTLYYWSDMDEDGYNMLGIFRKDYTHAKSVFMDSATFEIHEQEVERLPGKYKKAPPVNLTQAELTAFNRLMLMQGRIEQEKLKLSYIREVTSRY